jgi:hypothetical protein
LWVGSWASFSPADMLQRKRELDRLFFAYQAFFSPKALDAYREFAHLLFRIYGDPGTGALLRTEVESSDGNRRDAYPGTWDDRWTAMFAAPENRADREEVEFQYAELVARLGAEVGSDREGVREP